MRKTVKKIAAVVVAGVFAATMASAAAFGADGDLTLDGSISVSGLEAGDTAQYYQVVQQNATSGAWELTEDVDSDSDGKIDGSNYTIDDLVILDKTQEDKTVITKDIANAIASALTVNEASGTAMTVDGAGVAAAENVAAGLYMVSAVPGTGNVDTVYKPVFVSADYDADDETDSLALVEDETDYSGKPGVFKKSPLSIDKTSGVPADEDAGTPADTQRDVAVGDTVDFTITVPLLTYTKNFTDPQFKISDKMTAGLELVPNSITVVVKNDDTVVPTTEDTDYTITENPGKDGFVVEFLNDDPATPEDTQDGFLYTVVGAPTVTITYQATVTSDAEYQVNQMDNTATLNFSNAPDDENGNGELDDKTRHYTFDIDGGVLGGTGKTEEVEKIGIEADGKADGTTPVDNYPDGDADSTTDGKQAYSPLQNATFQLRTGSSTGDPVKFTNGVVDPNGSADLKSNADGSITMKGLDAGTYYLVETACPLGYSFDPSLYYTIVITPTYVDDADGNEILASYKIETTNSKTNETSVCEYTAATAGDPAKPVSFLNDEGELDVTADSLVPSEDNTSTIIVNKKLGILPATGGSGIYFYLGIGAAIMALAVLLALLKRRSRARA